MKKWMKTFADEMLRVQNFMSAISIEGFAKWAPVANRLWTES